jgi:hypothetical protein
LRSKDSQRTSVWTTLSPEEAVPNDRPLRPIRATVNDIIANLSPEFSRLHARRGPPSVPPERLLPALRLRAFFCYNLLFR